MSTVTGWVLKHKKLVVAFWLCLTAAGAFASLSVGNRLTKGLPIPGQPAYEANLKMLRIFGIDGHQEPSIAVLHLPAHLSMNTAAGRVAAARTFAAGSKAGPVGVIDYATTHDRRLVSADGRTTTAIFNMPDSNAARTSGTLGQLGPALKADAPTGASVALTGYEQLSAGSTGKGGGGPSALVETIIGALGALLVLAFVFASAAAVLPLLIAVVTILTTFLLVSGMTHLTSVSFIIQFLVALTPNVDIRVLAFGLAAGILVDATIIRSLLVPALVALFGRWNWWMPHRLERALRIAPRPGLESAS